MRKKKTKNKDKYLINNANLIDYKSIVANHGEQLCNS